MDDAVVRDKDNHPIGPRRGQRNRTLIAHFDPTPRTAASYKDCIGAEVEPDKKKKRTIIQVDTDHDDSDVEESMSVDSDLFPESDEESSSLNKKLPAVVTPPRGVTNATITDSEWITSTSTSRNNSTSNPQVDGGWSSRTWSVGGAANGWGASTGNNRGGGWSTSTRGWSVTKAGGGGNKVISIILTTVMNCTLHIFLQIYNPFFFNKLKYTFRKPPPRIKSKMSDYSVQSSGSLIVQRESTDEFYLRYKFGERLKVLEIGISGVASLEKQKIIDGYQCVLIATKFEKSDQSQQCNYSVCNKLSGPHVKGFYLSGRGRYNPKRAQEELNTIANFSELALDPGKLASRLELLVSPAKRGGGPKNNPYQFDLPLTMFEVFDACPENQTMGCGFIDPEVLKSLLGHTTCAENAAAIQGKCTCFLFDSTLKTPLY